MIPHVLTHQSLTVLLDGRAIAIPSTHANFTEILEHINDNEPDAIRALIDVKETISKFTQGKIEINDRVLSYAGRELNSSLATKIIEFVREGNPDLATPLINFLDKVMENPSYRAVTGLYDWVAASNMPIAPDGDIYAWKIVNAQFMDYHTGTYDHTPGNTVSEPRNFCDEDPDQTCSRGLHFCSFGYLPHYRNDEDRRVILVKINPKNVVAVPRDYQNAKGRCCEMTVVQEVPKDQVDHFFPTTTVYFALTETQSRFKVGDKWLNRQDDVLTIMSVDEYPDEDDDTSVWAMDENSASTCYYPDGRYYADPSEYDLVVQLVPYSAGDIDLGVECLTREGNRVTVTEVNYDTFVDSNDKHHWTVNGAQWKPPVDRQDPSDVLYLIVE